jgi:hypothetical protein
MRAATRKQQIAALARAVLIEIDGEELERVAGGHFVLPGLVPEGPLVSPTSGGVQLPSRHRTSQR